MWSTPSPSTDNEVVYLERDRNERDRYGREPAYVWFEMDGEPYMLNHVLINNGWAEDVDFSDRLYDEELKDAAALAKRHELGVWALCGGFEVPLTEQPQQEPPQQEPAVVEPEPQPQQPLQTGCDPSYPDLCLPIGAADLDCPQVGASDFTVLPSDPHGFDRNRDGIGCEVSPSSKVSHATGAARSKTDTPPAKPPHIPSSRAPAAARGSGGRHTVVTARRTRRKVLGPHVGRNHPADMPEYERHDIDLVQVPDAG